MRRRNGDEQRGRGHKLRRARAERCGGGAGRDAGDGGRQRVREPRA
jgi:hypothetical protein